MKHARNLRHPKLAPASLTCATALIGGTILAACSSTDQSRTIPEQSHSPTLSHADPSVLWPAGSTDAYDLEYAFREIDR